LAPAMMVISIMLGECALATKAYVEAGQPGK
jgi:hypothetical protein